MILTPSSPRDLSVLVLEDNLDHATLIESALKTKDECFRVDLCREPVDFFDLLKNRRYDAAVIDYYLGDSHGLEVLRELNASPHKLPVIFISGVDNRDLIKKGLAAGASDFVVKSRESLRRLPVVVKQSIIRKMNSAAAKPTTGEIFSQHIGNSLGRLSDLSLRLRQKLTSGEFVQEEIEHLEEILENTTRLLKKAKGKISTPKRSRKTKRSPRRKR